MQTKWILCPVCGNKIRTMIRENTELKNFPLYCPKCKKETIINVQDMKITGYLCQRISYAVFAVGSACYFPVSLADVLARFAGGKSLNVQHQFVTPIN